jgi:hypothetical protein
MTGIHLQDAIANFEPSIARLEDPRTRRRSLRIQQLLIPIAVDDDLR